MSFLKKEAFRFINSATLFIRPKSELQIGLIISGRFAATGKQISKELARKNMVKEWTKPSFVCAAVGMVAWVHTDKVATEQDQDGISGYY